MRVLSGRAYLERPAPSVILFRQGKSLGNALKHRSQLAVVAPPRASRQSTLCDRIAALAELGAATLAAERYAIAFRLNAASADDIVYAPRGDSRWDEVLNPLLAALDHRLTDAIAAGAIKRAEAESIESVALKIGRAHV